MKKRRLSDPGGLALLLKKSVMFMKFHFVFVFLLSLNISASVYSQQNLVSLNLQNVEMEEFIRAVKQQTGVHFLYNSALIREAGKVSVTAQAEELADVLKRVLETTVLEYEYQNDVIVIKKKGDGLPEEKKVVSRKITGKVVDESGNPLPGVTVMIEGTQLGAATDVNGLYSITLPEGEVALLFTFVGMKPQTIVVGSKSEINVTMLEDSESLGEVVVTGMFNRKKEGFTGSATKVTGEEIKRMTSGNVLKAIEMLDPGFRMNVNNIAGSNPNAVPDFQMRGQANMGDYSTDDVVVMRGDIDSRPNQPLFVLDGIIGVSVTKIIDMDPEQIESITLLKDAAAMVIYGSQASNGVVVVETKAPEKGTLRVSYNGNYKVEAPDLSVYHLLNAKDKLELERRAGYYDETFPVENAANLYQQYKNKLMEVERGVNTYWLRQPVQAVFNHRHGINLEGGDQSLRYKIYFGLNCAPGVMKETGIVGKSASIDIRYRYKGLLISNQMYVDYTKGDRTSPYGAFSTYSTLNPYYRLRDVNGNIPRVLEYSYDWYGNKLGALVLNPMYNTLFRQKDQSTAFEIRDAFRVEYRPIENLSFSMDVNLSKLNNDLDIFKPASHTDFDGLELEKKGSYHWNNNKTTRYDVSFTANYNKSFVGDHLLSLFARYNVNENFNHLAGVNVTGFPNDEMDEVFLGAVADKVTGNEGTTRALGFVGTVNYSYKQRYAVDFSMRLDASSEFGRNNRYAPFWSAGLRWNADHENFIQRLKVFDELVFRATYGVTGSQGFSPYQSLQMYTYDGMMQIYHSSDVIGAKLWSMGNPDLKWQKTDAYNIGMDFNMLKGIISGRLEYYHKYTRNTLLDYSLPPSVGFSTIPDNMGNISNKGVEATLRIMPYNNLQKRLNFNFVLTGSHNKNRIEKISNALKIRNGQSVADTKSRPLPRYEEGYSQTMIWVVRSLGIDPATGREVFLKRNGETTSIYDGSDQIPYGDTEPKLQGSLAFNLNWKGFSFSLAAQYHFGGQVYNKTLVDKVENADLQLNVDERAFTERWQKPGDVTFFKGITRSVNGSNTKASSRFVMDDNELALTTISLQYRFERRYQPFIRKVGLSSASLGLYLEDIARFSSVKMERGIEYPFARQVSMSLNLVF